MANAHLCEATGTTFNIILHRLRDGQVFNGGRVRPLWIFLLIH
jgi:hypothetical protein